MTMTGHWKKFDDGTAVVGDHGAAVVVRNEPLRGRMAKRRRRRNRRMTIWAAQAEAQGMSAGSAGPGGRPDGDGGQQRTIQTCDAGGDQAPDGMVVLP